MIIRDLLIILFSFCTIHSFSQSISDSIPIEKEVDLNKVDISYGSKGFQFKTADKRFMLQIQSRFQFRYANPSDQDPLTLNDYSSENNNLFLIRRARLKVGGYAYKPWLKYYWEYGLQGSNLLDFRLMIEKWKALSFKVGQWKVEYSRERRVSSGKQQMVDRSLINRPFTVDRQQGVEVYGHLDGNGALDFNYWAAVLTGAGRGYTRNDDENLMYFGRFQWNFLGRELDFISCDVDRHEKPAGIIAVSAVTNTSNFTRFSTSGGGYLDGYNQADTGLFQVNQVNFETAFMYKGFSWQSEFHLKEIIDDNGILENNTLKGYYVQAGYFFNEIISWWPEELEFAIRNSMYQPNDKISVEKGHESTAAFNWFFNGHANKLTTEVSYFDYEEEFVNLKDQWRFRIQWDISL